MGFACLSRGLGSNLRIRTLADAPNTHNMLVFGERTVYLSHLPMFDGLNRQKTEFTSPHRYQVIMEATFSDGARRLTDVYAADRKAHPAVKMYTLNPALFVLPDLDPAGSSPRRSFRGNALFRGHLERGGQAFIGDGASPPAGGLFDVNVARVVHFQQFTPKTAKPANLEYILFGSNEETFLAHLIMVAPDFDQIISVHIEDQKFSDDELNRGIKVLLEKPNSAGTRIKEKDRVPGVFATAGTERAQPFNVEGVREIYFEEGELLVPPSFEPSAEEKKAGFR